MSRNRNLTCILSNANVESSFIIIWTYLKSLRWIFCYTRNLLMCFCSHLFCSWKSSCKSFVPSRIGIEQTADSRSAKKERTNKQTDRETDRWTDGSKQFSFNFRRSSIQNWAVWDIELPRTKKKTFCSSLKIKFSFYFLFLQIRERMWCSSVVYSPLNKSMPKTLTDFSVTFTSWKQNNLHF